MIVTRRWQLTLRVVALAYLGVLVALVALRKPTRTARHPDDAPVLPAPSST